MGIGRKVHLNIGCFDAKMLPMFDSPESGEERTNRWFAVPVYSLWTVIGLFGAVVSLFWKVGSSRWLGSVCYLTVFVLALCFLIEALRIRPPSSRKESFRAGLLLMISLMPMLIRSFLS